MQFCYCQFELVRHRYCLPPGGEGMPAGRLHGFQL